MKLTKEEILEHFKKDHPETETVTIGKEVNKLNEKRHKK